VLTGSRQAPCQLARRQNLRDLLHGRHAHARELPRLRDRPDAPRQVSFPRGPAGLRRLRGHHPGLPLLRLWDGNRALPPEHLRPLLTPERPHGTAARGRVPRHGNNGSETALRALRSPAPRKYPHLAPQDWRPRTARTSRHWRLPLSHEALDKEPNSLRVEHLRSLLINHQLLPARDHYLALFERWFANKLEGINDPEVQRPIESFARWHHLRRIRSLSTEGKPTQGPVHSAKQEITETIKFLTWLKLTHGRTAVSCVQADVNAWLAEGPTTRHAIRTFFVWAVENRTCTNITIGFRQAKTVALLTQGQRLAMLKACLTNDVDTLSYRVAAILLLLYAQPVVKIAALKSTDVILTPDGLRLSLGEEHTAPVPEPFASLLTEHLASRPNMRTGSSSGSQWLFPGYRPGQHIHPNTLMQRLRETGINLLGARNASLRGLVNEVPAPLVAEMLGYSYQVTQKHAAAAAEPWSRYPHTEPRRIMADTP